MEYTLHMGPWSSVFAVPTALVDRYIKLAGKEQLQVLLWMLRHGGETVQPDLLAHALGMSLDSALDALDYWVQEGLLAGQEGELSPARRVQAAQPEDGPAPLPEAGGGTAASLPPKRRLLKPDTQHLAARMGESEGIRFLMQEAENTLGKTLSPAMASTLLTICDDYGLPVEVVVMLLHYAKNVGRRHGLNRLCGPGLGRQRSFYLGGRRAEAAGAGRAPAGLGQGAVRGGNAPALSL